MFCKYILLFDCKTVVFKTFVSSKRSNETFLIKKELEEEAARIVNSESLSYLKSEATLAVSTENNLEDESSRFNNYLDGHMLLSCSNPKTIHLKVIKKYKLPQITTTFLYNMYLYVSNI